MPACNATSCIRTVWVPSSRRVRLVVQDSGTGFPENILKRAFEPYVTTKAKGTGLGLAVVKKIADEHGSRIDIANRVEDGKVLGAQVSLSFAVDNTATGQRPSLRLLSALARDSEIHMANILVVDDELGIRDLLQEILNDEGHTVEVAENAQQAREARLRDRPDLVLLDIWMPDTDGVTLLKEWSSCGALTMPVIMMSGHATIDTAVEATKIGALAFLEKPITMQKLLKAVEQGLTRGTVRKPPSASGLAPVATAMAIEMVADSSTELAARCRQQPAAAPELRSGQAAARGARRVRESLFRIPPGA